LAWSCAQEDETGGGAVQADCHEGRQIRWPWHFLALYPDYLFTLTEARGRLLDAEFNRAFGHALRM